MSWGSRHDAVDALRITTLIQANSESYEAGIR